MVVTRRRFLQYTAVASSALPLGSLFQQRAHAASAPTLLEDPDGILDLPQGFSYTIIERAFDDMSDGYRVPARADGMACFVASSDTYALMRNHEVSRGDVRNGPYKAGQDPPVEAYDRAAMGGVTRVILDRNSLERLSSNLVLTGTVRNCGGGPSPWGWLSCEETTSPGHGYVFLCPVDTERVSIPRRIVGYGRFNHEAVAVDPRTRIAYLTEDRGDGAVYRFVPDHPDAPFVGTLQALRVVGEPGFNTSTNMAVGDSRDIDWVAIDDVNPIDDSVRHEAREKGAARVSRGEGVWYANRTVYLCSTNGGPVGKGQIFAIDIDAQTLTLIAHSNNAVKLDNPDNITVAPWGEVYMAEDGEGEQYIRVLGADGDIRDFARNAASSSEFAGVCFAPDGRAMFVNIQKDGLTLAITGDFPAIEPAPLVPLEAGSLDPEPGVYTSQWNPAPNDSGCSASGGDALAGTAIGTLASAVALRRARALTDE